MNVCMYIGFVVMFTFIYNRAKDQLLVNWETSIKRVRTQLTQFLTQSAEDTTVKEVCLGIKL